MGMLLALATRGASEKSMISITIGSSSISVIQWHHSRPHQFWAGATVH
jgi:hypothetical protein